VGEKKKDLVCGKSDALAKTPGVGLKAPCTRKKKQFGAGIPRRKKKTPEGEKGFRQQKERVGVRKKGSVGWSREFKERGCSGGKTGSQFRFLRKEPNTRIANRARKITIELGKTHQTLGVSVDRTIGRDHNRKTNKTINEGRDKK